MLTPLDELMDFLSVRTVKPNYHKWLDTIYERAYRIYDYNEATGWIKCDEVDYELRDVVVMEDTFDNWILNNLRHLALNARTEVREIKYKRHNKSERVNQN